MWSKFHRKCRTQHFHRALGCMVSTQLVARWCNACTDRRYHHDTATSPLLYHMSGGFLGRKEGSFDVDAVEAGNLISCLLQERLIKRYTGCCHTAAASVKLLPPSWIYYHPSIPPSSVTVCSKALAKLSGLVTSAFIYSVLTPNSLDSCSKSPTGFDNTSSTETFPPNSAMALVAAYPMPRPPPVITKFLPVKSNADLALRRSPSARFVVEAYRS